MLESNGLKTLSIKPIESNADHCGLGRWVAGDGHIYG